VVGCRVLLAAGGCCLPPLTSSGGVRVFNI